MIVALVVGLYVVIQLVNGFSPQEKTYFSANGPLIVREHRLTGTFLGPEGLGYVGAYFTMLGVVERASGVWRRFALLVVPLSALGTVASGARIFVAALAVAGSLLLVQLIRQRIEPKAAARVLLVGVVGAVALTAAVLASPTNRQDVVTASNAVQSQVH